MPEIDLEKLDALLAKLRERGVSHFECGGLVLTLAPQPAPAPPGFVPWVPQAPRAAEDDDGPATPHGDYDEDELDRLQFWSAGGPPRKRPADSDGDDA